MPNNFSKISCVIAAYNEEQRIKDVLNVICKHPLINEIIVVDGASTDNTRKIVAEFPNIILIAQEKKGGKSADMAEGIARATGDLIFMCDADLEGLKSEHVTALIEPVLDHQADQSISLRANTPWLWHVIGIDWLSADRVFPKTFIAPHLKKLSELLPYGIESYMNRFIIKNKLRIKSVYCEGLADPLKFKKIGIFKGLIKEFGMRLDITRTVSPVGKYYQITRLYFLLVK